MRNRSAKILATLGPASRDPKVMRLLSDAGADAFRLNFSHGSHEDHGTNLATIRALEAETGRHIAAVADVQGPKLRTGTFEGGGTMLGYNTVVDIVLASEGGREGVIPMPHPELFKASTEGTILKLDDGKLQVTVVEAGADKMRARVDVPGRVSDRKGVNVVNAVLPMSAMTDKDREDIAFALSQGVDYIALSFVQTPDDVREARAIIGDQADIIVKLEKPSAIEPLGAILDLADASDALMVARGDLGVELPLEQVPLAQRRIIRAARARGKPVIVATQMLQSMVESPTPTRAEASDTAAAVYLGADAVMLSAESAVGRHPEAAVAIMTRIIRAASADPDYAGEMGRVAGEQRAGTPAAAVAMSAASTADSAHCAAVVASTNTGGTAYAIAKLRPAVPIIVLTPNERTARQAALVWGTTPVLVPEQPDFEALSAKAAEAARDALSLGEDDRVVLLAGIPTGVTGGTNTLKLIRIGDGR